jgi:nucleotide-binding universal stress UspA family protein
VKATAPELVVGVDGSAASYAAVSWAAREAAMRRLDIRIVHVIAPTSMSSTDAPDDTITGWQEVKARQAIERARRIVVEQKTESRPRVHVEVAYAGVLATLVDASRNAEMIVVGTRGVEEFGGHRLGSVSSGLLHHARCPVVVVRDPDSVGREIPDDAPVLVGIEGSPAAQAATALAFDEASRRRSP